MTWRWIERFRHLSLWFGWGERRGRREGGGRRRGGAPVEDKVFERDIEGAEVSGEGRHL